jgi:hypothetical protein
MKRDMDLVRAILMDIENGARFDGSLYKVEIPGYSDEIIGYHVMLMSQAGLIMAQDASSLDGLDWIPIGLTWDGHEFLDASRDDTRWAMAKDIVSKGAGTLSIEALKIALGTMMKQAITGIM